jgi:hypothetical protein
MKKCKSCGAPLEGFMYNTIGKLMGVKPSENDPETCNKCAAKPATEETAEATPTPEMSTQESEAPAEETTPEAPAEETTSEEEKPEQNV